MGGKMCWSGEGGDWGACWEVGDGLPGQGIRLWVPLRGDDPAGLHLTLTHDALSVVEVELAGARGSWTLPPVTPRSLTPSHHSAERLPDGRIALVAIEEGRQGPGRVLLHLLGAQGEVSDSVLAEGNRYGGVATELDERGRLVVALNVTRDGKELVEVAAIEAGETSAGEWRTVSGDGAASSPRLIEVEHGMVAAWIERGMSGELELRACDVRGDRPHPLSIRVGTMGFDSPRTHRFAAHAVDEQPLFVWYAAEGVTARRVPPSVSGLAVLEQLSAMRRAAKPADVGQN